METKNLNLKKELGIDHCHKIKKQEAVAIAMLKWDG